MTLLLQNIRIVDLTRVLAGPLCSMILGDLGADVIKVERPQGGDESRGWGPPFDDEGKSAYYLSVNRNKLAIALDLGDPADQAVLMGLIADADVVLDNFLAGALERRGIDAGELLEAHQRLIWCTISGFGPNSDRPGYDFVVQAESGWMSITGDPNGAPTKVGVALADVVAGKDAAIAVLGALVARERVAAPLAAAARRLHVSLARSAIAALVNVAQNTLVSGRDAERYGNAHPNLVPYELFRAADRPIVVAVGNDAQWLSACRALALDSLASDPDLATNAGRIAQRARVAAAYAARMAERPADFWLGVLRVAGVPCGVVQTVREALQSVGATARLGIDPSVPGAIRLPPPRLDEHGAVIRRHGWNAFRHAAAERSGE